MPITNKDLGAPEATPQPAQLQATYNLNAVTEVPPAAAGSAIAAAPSSGIPPTVGMMNPSVGSSIQQRNDNARIINSNPAVANFIATSPAHAAVAQNDLPILDQISRGVSSWVGQLKASAGAAWKGYSPWESLDSPVVSALHDAGLPAFNGEPNTSDQIQKEQQAAFAAGDWQKGLRLGAQRVGAAAGVAFSPWTGLLNLATDPVGRAIASIPGSNQFPDKTVSPGEAAQRYSGLLGSIASLGAGEKFTTHPGEPIHLVNEEGPLPSGGGKGPVPIDPEGYHPVDDKGFVTDAEGKPYSFSTAREAALWQKNNLQDTGQQFNPHGTQDGKGDVVYTVREASRPQADSNEAAAIDQAVAESHVQQAQSIDDTIAQSETAKHSPQMMQEFLEQQEGVKDHTVGVYAAAVRQTFEGLSSRDMQDAEHPLNKFLTKHNSALKGSLLTGQKAQIPLSDYLMATAGQPYAEALHATTDFTGSGQSLKDIQENKSPALAEKKPEELPKLSDWQYRAPKPGGSQPGAFYSDEQGNTHLVKGAVEPNDDRARNEVLASKLMSAAGISSPNMKLIQLGEEHGGGLGVASRELNIAPINSKMANVKEELQHQFAVHAWLGNRDVIGTGTAIGGSDNTGLTGFYHSPEREQFPEVTHFDPGGALRYRAQGKEKADFGARVSEWENLRSEQVNAHAHAWFGDMTKVQLEESAYLVADVPDSKIRSLVEESGVKDPENLIQTLIARKHDIMQRAGLLAPEDAPVLQTLEAKVSSAVAQIAKDRALDTVFENNKALGMTKGQYNRHADAVEQAFDELKRKTLAKIVKHIQTSWKAQYNEAYNRHLAQTTNEVLNQPIIKASHSLRFTVKQENDLLTKNNEFAPGGKPITFYTGAHIGDIGTPENPKFLPKNYDVISFSTSPEFVNRFKGFNNPETIKPGSTIYIVHLRAKSIGDFRRPADLDKAANWLYNNANEGSANINNIKSVLKDGYYPFWENVKMQKALGWEGSYMRENPSSALNANVQSGDQVVFKYAQPQDAVKTKISTAEKSLYPKALIDQLPPNIFAKEGGLTADHVASQFGVGSGQELLESLAGIEAAKGDVPFRQWLVDSIKGEAHDRTVSEVGNLLDQGRILAAANEAFSEPTVEHLLIQQLKELLGEVRKQDPNQKLDVASIKATALNLFDGKTAFEGKNIKQLEAGMKKSGELVEASLQKGKPIEAFKAKQQQLLNHYQLQEAHKFREEFVKGTRALSQLGRKAAIEKLEPNLAAVLQDYLDQMHLRSGRDPGELQRFLAEQPLKTMEDVIEHLYNLGYPVDFASLPQSLRGRTESVLTQNQFAKSISVKDFRDQMDMISGVQKAAREFNEIIAGEEKAELTHLANIVESNGNNLGGGKTPQEIGDSRRNFFQNMQSHIASLYASNIRPEVFLHWIDNQEQGPLSRYVVGPLMQGKYTETDLIESWVHDLTHFEGAKEVHNSMHKGITAPDYFTWQTARGSYRPITTRGNMLKAVSNLGTGLGRKKLFAGFGIPEELWDTAEHWLVSQVTDHEWNFLETMRGQYGKLFKLADKNYMEFRGYGLKKAEERPLLNGKQVGYAPLSYNSELSDLAKLEGISSARAPGDLLAGRSEAQLTSNGFSKERTNFVGPLDLNYMHFSSDAAEIMHDIAFRQPLHQAQKILSNPRVATTIRFLLGNEYANQVQPWLRYIAEERMLYDPATEKTAQGINAVVNNIAYAHIAWQIYSALKHMLIATSHIAGELHGDVKTTAVAFKDLFGNGPKQQYWQQFCRDNFGEVRGSKWNLDVSVHDMLGNNPFGMNAASTFKELGTLPFMISKQLEGYLVSLVRYRQEISQHGDHELAVLSANKAVRDTQGAGHPVDLPAMFRGDDTPAGVIGRSMTRFLSFENTGTNRIWVSLQQAKQGQFGKAAYNQLFYVVVPAVLLALFETYLQGNGDPKKSEKENLTDNFGWSLAQNTVGSIPGPNILFQAFRGYGEGGMLGSYADLGKNAIEHKPTKHMIKDLGEILGEPLGVPDSFPKEGQNIYDAFHPENLQPEEQTPTAWAQRAVMGRSAHYEKSNQGRGFRR
jgi:hypothetical protein